MIKKININIIKVIKEIIIEIIKRVIKKMIKEMKQYLEDDYCYFDNKD